MFKLPTIKQVLKAKQKTPWEWGNRILYEMCRNSFFHKKSDEIISKVLFIGRIYAAAIERRKNKKNEINENFYIDVVEPAFRKSKLDEKLAKLKIIKEIQIDNIETILQIHYYLTSLIKGITNLEKRSFSSKYLHFHLPHLFFIYDNRAKTGLSKYYPKVVERQKYSPLK